MSVTWTYSNIMLQLGGMSKKSSNMNKTNDIKTSNIFILYDDLVLFETFVDFAAIVFFL